MGDWWIDEAAYAGPSVQPTPLETLIEWYLAVGQSYRSLGLFLGRTWGKTSMHEAMEQYAKDATEAVMEGLKPIKLLLDEMELANKRLNEKLKGRGQISGHGPRTATTYGRNGKRRY